MYRSLPLLFHIFRYIHRIKNQRFSNFKQITFQGFLCNAFNFHRIRYDYRFIDIMGLNLFNDKFSIKLTFLKVTRYVFNVHIIPYDYRFIDIMGLNFLTINFR